MPQLNSLLKLNLLKELGLEKLDKESQGQLLLKMTEVIEKRILHAIFAQLNPDDEHEFDRVMARNGDVLTFVRSRVPDLDRLMAEVVANFKQEMLDLNRAVSQPA